MLGVGWGVFVGCGVLWFLVGGLGLVFCGVFGWGGCSSGSLFGLIVLQRLGVVGFVVFWVI
jgi:hypothetical protein